jgi:ATP-dependent protease ClpP protease subunit
MKYWQVIRVKRSKKIIKDSDRDNFMSPDQAAKYGLIDAVVDSRSAKK